MKGQVAKRQLLKSFNKTCWMTDRTDIWGGRRVGWKVDEITVIYTQQKKLRTTKNVFNKKNINKF